MAIKHNRLRAGGFIISEEGSLSRDGGYLAEGENLDAGTLLEENDDGDLIAWTAGDNSVVGILFDGADARTGRVQVALVARFAVVSLDSLTYPEGMAATARDALAAIRIIVLADHALADTGRGGGEPVWLPEGAVVFSDFAADHHYAGGEEVTLIDLWEENLDWSVWNPALIVPGEGIAADPNDAAPTMKRTYSAPILAGNDFYIKLTGLVDSNIHYEIAATELPNYSRHRQVKPAQNASANHSTYDYNDFSGHSGDASSYAATPNICCVVAITSSTMRVCQNGGDVQEYEVSTDGDPLTDLCLGILNSDNSRLKSAAYWSGVPSDATMRALALVGAASPPVNVTPLTILDNIINALIDVPSVWSGNPLPPPPPDYLFTYQWYLDGLAIEGATSGDGYSYQLGDEGKSLTLVETATNPSGSVDVTSSNAVIVPAPPPPE